MNDETFSVVKDFFITVDAFFCTEIANKAGYPDPSANPSSNSY